MFKLIVDYFKDKGYEEETFMPGTSEAWLEKGIMTLGKKTSNYGTPDKRMPKIIRRGSGFQNDYSGKGNPILLNKLRLRVYGAKGSKRQYTLEQYTFAKKQRFVGGGYYGVGNIKYSWVPIKSKQKAQSLLKANPSLLSNMVNKLPAMRRRKD